MQPRSPFARLSLGVHVGHLVAKALQEGVSIEEAIDALQHVIGLCEQQGRPGAVRRDRPLPGYGD